MSVCVTEINVCGSIQYLKTLGTSVEAECNLLCNLEDTMKL
jgi:hypothetical protein